MVDYLSQHPIGVRDTSQKFTDSESKSLNLIAQTEWTKFHANSAWLTAPIMDLHSPDFTLGHHPDGEKYVFVNQPGIRSHNPNIYVAANLETAQDLFTVRSLLKYYQNPSSILASLYFPYARADRTKIRPDGNVELILLDLLFADLFTSGVRGLILVDPHSPALSWYCLKSGIVPLSLSALPSLIEAGKQLNLLPSRDLICATPDSGGLPMSRLASHLGGELEVLIGSKERTKTGAIVTYPPQDLEKVVGKTVIFADDVISTGATLHAAATELLDHGAAQIVILSTYSVFSGQALKLLGFDSRIKIITTDGFTPLIDLSQSPNITVVPLKDKLGSVLELIKSGEDFWHSNGQSQLQSLGFCLY